MEVREPTFQILSALAAGETHGYLVMRESGLDAGTVYTALKRLADAGYVTQTATQVVDGRNRRYYDLTAEGIQLLRDEIDRSRRYAAMASKRLRGHT